MAEARYSQADRVILDSLNSHLQRHEDKIDPKVHRHRILLLGPNEDNGLCADFKDLNGRVEELEKTNDKLDKVLWAVLTAVGIQVILAIPQIIAALN